MAVKKKVVKKRRATKEEMLARLTAALRAEADLIESLNLQAEAAKRRRDALIVKVADRGISEREIGRMANISGPRVNQIYHGTNGR